MHNTKFVLAALLALPLAGCAKAKPDPKEPVAKIGSQTITAGELDKEVKGQLQQLENEYQEKVYQTKRQALESIIQKRVFEAKAKEAGVATPEELVQKDILSKIADPSDAEVQQVYDGAKANGQQLPPIEQVKPDIIRFIKAQKGQGELMAYYEKLKADQKVEILLPAYLPPKVSVEAKGPAKGPKNAPVIIVEFSDFQCPYCIRAEKTVSDLLAAYPEKIRLVYRDFPLPIHKLAPKAAEASQCAADQDKYWEMHDKLFSVEGKLEIDNLKKYARDVGLDGDKFDKCLDSGEKAKVVAEAHKAGEDLGINGTPAFFINGRLISGAQPLDEFKKLVDAELTAVAKK
ncbi:MAG TPA: thioredoxin domain-containing protein [Anaeromyxobacter sp.]|nr:thioredoxin domain-containing protein [Anaeromyxobacter sp.]